MRLFSEDKLLLLDTDVAVRLQSCGMPSDAFLPVWALSHAQQTVTALREDIAAGCEALCAPTDGAIRPRIRARGLRRDVRKLNGELVAAAREAADGRPVGGAIGSTGLRIYPVGSAAFDDLTRAFYEQAAALEEAGVDFYCVRSQESLAECRAALLALRAVTEKPVVVTMRCDASGRTPNGEDLPSVLVALQDMGVSAFGMEGTGNMGLISRQISRMKSHAVIPLCVRADAGRAVLRGGVPCYAPIGGKVAAALPKLAGSGVRLFGGGAGTGPELIAALREAAQSWMPDEIASVEERPTVAASPFRLQELTPRLKIGDIAIDENILENASVYEAMGIKLLRLELHDDEELDLLDEAQYTLRLPIAVHCADGELLERFLKIYNGKPVIL